MSLLIFDEVMTGFRLAKGGAQERFGIHPDITCLGKIIGGGLPMGAYGASHELMTHVAPEGPMYQAGTLSGNPLAVAAGIATLDALGAPGRYETLEANSQYFGERLEKELTSVAKPLCLNRVGSMFTLFFTDGPVERFSQVKRSDTAAFAKFFHELLEEGIYMPPSAFEACFLSLAHEREDLDCIVNAFAKVLRGI